MNYVGSSPVTVPWSIICDEKLGHTMIGLARDKAYESEPAPAPAPAPAPGTLAMVAGPAACTDDVMP